MSHELSIDPMNVSAGDAGWGAPISEDAARELTTILQKWERETLHEDRIGPFQDVVLTGAEVFWLAVLALAGPNGDITNAEHQLRAATEDRRQHVPFHLPGLAALHLERANLRGAHLEGAILGGAHLEEADLADAHLEGASLRAAILDRANLQHACLQSANLAHTHLEQAVLYQAQLDNVSLRAAILDRANLFQAHLKGANMSGSQLAGASLGEADLEGAELIGVQLAGAGLLGARLTGAKLTNANLEGTDLRNARLEGVDLRGATMDAKTRLEEARLTDEAHGSPAFGDIQWNGVNLSRIEWDDVRRFGDERYAGLRDGISNHRAVVRAYRQVSAQLRAQGLSEEADRFAYRAHVRKRGVLLRQLKIPQYLGSWFLAMLAGYGYRPGRSLLWYIVVIFGFALAYAHFGHVTGHSLDFEEALIFSITSFHGRGFFPGGLDLKDVVSKLAALEAVLGLLIEVSFIATFTQRFFGTK